MEGFEKINFENIGLVKDKYRPNPPLKDKYRKEIREILKDTPSYGKTYDRATINERFPLPEYLKE